MSNSNRNWPPEAPELAAFRGPHVAVDIALLTVEPDPIQTSERTSTSSPSERGFLGRHPRLAALVVRRQDGLAAGQWALPGRMVRERERLKDAVNAALEIKCGITGLEPTQLFVADEPTRDDRGWVMSVAHRVVVPWEELFWRIEGRSDLGLVRIAREEMRFERPDDQPTLPFEHEEILRTAVLDIRSRYNSAPDPDGLLSGTFTFYQLRKVHEAVAGRTLDKDLFRRQMLPFLETTGQVGAGYVGKPAKTYLKKSPNNSATNS